MTVSNFCSLAIMIFSISYGDLYPQAPGWVDPHSGITMDAALFDFDRDGDLDIVTAEYSYPDGGYLYLYENFDGIFSSDPIWQSANSEGFECVTTGDMDNNGFVDIIAGTVNLMPNDGSNYIYFNSGTLPIGLETSPSLSYHIRVYQSYTEER